MSLNEVIFFQQKNDDIMLAREKKGIYRDYTWLADTKFYFVANRIC